jgi:hypothetical protein
LVWPFADAPEEFRRLSPFSGEEEAVVYVPPELVDEDNSVRIDAPAFWFLDWIEKARGGRVMHAGEDWGLYSLHQLPDKGIVAITSDSDTKKKHLLPRE